MKVLIFGGTGLLGTDIHKVCKGDFDVVALGSSDVNITNLDAVYHSVKTHKPDVAINSAALTDVDICEQDPDKAYIVNAMGPKNIAMACRDMKIKLIQISTDYVFDGDKKEPYTEFDTAAPVNVYGRSKLAGEEFVKMITNNFMIIRTAWLFGERRNHFVDYVINALKNGNEITAVRDMMSSPTFSLDVAETIKKMLAMNQTGIFHMCNKGYCSRVEMVEEIMKITNKPGHMNVTNQSQWKKPAKRPVFSALRNYHLSLINEDDMSGWRDALKRYIKTKFKD
jgi:dTDP-4-dehydrorhamnose reductase